MVKDAESHAEEDKKRKDEIEVRNQVTPWHTAPSRPSKTFGDKVPEDQKKAVEEAVAEAKTALMRL